MVDEIKASRDEILTRLTYLEQEDTDSLRSEMHNSRRYFNHPKAVTHTPLVYPAMVVDKQSSKKHSQGQTAYTWQPTQLKDLRHIKESVVSYGLHSPYVKQLLHSWATFNRVTPADWVGLASAVLDNSCLIEWRALFREEAGILERQAARDGVDAPLQKILGEGIYSDPQIQAEYDDHTLSLCRTAALNAWDKVRESGEQLEAFTKIEQGQTEPFKDFLDRLTRAVDKQVTDLTIRHPIVYSLAYHNANPMCKRILLPLKIRSAPLEEWVLHTAHIDCNIQDTGIWAEEAVPRGFNKQQEIRRDSNRRTWEGRAPYRGSHRYREASAHRHLDPEPRIGRARSGSPWRRQENRCFSCGKIGHTKKNCRQRNSRDRSLPSGLCRRCGKGKHWTNECRSTRDFQGKLLAPGNSERGLEQAPRTVRSFPVTVEDNLSQDK
ncbi:endogenous retrovirus group K member 113 Gag polyprotein-like [Cricetulus griseus]|uniref:Endogenous retrovirus group K member 113 Gag polyprotein-like n=1 Tax=Cricetulus griseus TaxID=10029 RepID=A0A9J7GP16_CRIGR|nr:endogenous retrovirus group K member 113 Gag polyprotein-like [Cricetulus griseus]